MVRSEILFPDNQRRDGAIILALTFLTCFASRQIDNAKLRQVLISGIGLALIFSFTGTWSCISIFSTMIIMACLSKSSASPRLVFIAALGWRVLCVWLGDYYEKWDTDFSVTGSVNMMLTLRFITVSYEIHDLREENKLSKAKQLNTRFKSSPLLLEKEPSILEILLYYLCCPGLFSGPTYTFRTYDDAMKKTCVKRIPYIREVGRRISPLPVIMVFQYMTKSVLGFQVFYENDFYSETNFLTRILYVVAITVNTQLFMMTVWTLSECMCLTVGLGVYPEDMAPVNGQGPRKGFSKKETELNNESIQWNYDTTRNNVMTTYFLTKRAATAMSQWNRTCQWWLLHHCYMTTAIKPSRRILRVSFTLFISALWHGPNVGYHITSLAMGVTITVERLCMEHIRNNLPQVALVFYDGFTLILFRWITFNFACVPFFVHDSEIVHKLFAAVYFLPFFIIMGAVAALAVSIAITPNKNIEPKQFHLETDAVTKKE